MPPKKIFFLFAICFISLFFVNCNKDNDKSANTPFVVVFTDRDGNIYAVDPVTGKLKYGSFAGYTFSSPAVYDNTVYIGTITGKLCAIDIATGDPKPHFPISVSDKEIRSMPIIYNGAVYFGSMDNKIYAYDIASGQLKQGFPVTTGGWVISSPTISNGFLYVGSYDGKLYAVNATTGTLKTGFPVTTGDIISSSPLVQDGVVYVGSRDFKVYAFDSNTGTPKAGFPVSTGGMIYSSPTINKGVLYVAGTDSKLTAIDISTGAVKAGFPVSLNTNKWVESSPVISESTVFIGNANMSGYPPDSELFAFDAATGNPKAGFPVTLPNAVFASPVVYNGTVYVGCDDNKLYAIDAKTGTIKWSFTALGRIYSSPCIQLTDNTTVYSSLSGVSQ